MVKALEVIEESALGQGNKGRESQELGAPGWEEYRRQKGSSGRGPR